MAAQVPDAAAAKSARTEAHAWGLTLKNLLLPIYCKKCGRRLLTEENGYFCPECWEESPKIERPVCPRCGKPHPGAVGFATRSNFPCAQCRAHPNRYIQRIYAPARFDGALAMAVKLLKFYGKQRLAGPLGELMADYATKEMNADAYNFVVPVPLHRVRARARGYNQSELLAKAVLHVFPNAHLDLALHRIRPTRTQSRLTERDRRNNVRGAFAVLGEGYRGAAILLIDDVVTTAETVTECAKALRRGGAGTIDVLAAALAVPGEDEDRML